jgi:hypothetical protein
LPALFISPSEYRLRGNRRAMASRTNYEFVVELRLSDQPPIADSDRFRLMKMSADEQAAGFAMLC